MMMMMMTIIIMIIKTGVLLTSPSPTGDTSQSTQVCHIRAAPQVHAVPPLCVMNACLVITNEPLSTINYSRSKTLKSKSHHEPSTGCLLYLHKMKALTVHPLQLQAHYVNCSDIILTD